MQNEHTPKTLEERVIALEVKVKRYERIIFWFVVINVLLVVVPTVGLFVAVPQFLETYTTLPTDLGI